MTRHECENEIGEILEKAVSVFCFTDVKSIPSGIAGLQIEVKKDVWECMLEVKAKSQSKALIGLLAAVKALEGVGVWDQLEAHVTIPPKSKRTFVLKEKHEQARDRGQVKQ